LTISQSSFISNQAVQQGGALWIDGDGETSINSSTFWGNNVVNDQGGALTYNGNGPVRMDHVTIVANTAGRACGALWFGDPKIDFVISNSIVANNQARQDHAQDQIGYNPIDGGGNIEYPTPRFGGRRVASNSRIVDPLLKELSQSNGTYVLLPNSAGSPAVDTATSTPYTRDQRGFKITSKPDVGAVEFEASCN
jgi:hypothetical protein